MLYDYNAARNVLGCLMQNTNLLFNKKYPIQRTDFEENRFHYYLFGCIEKLAEQGAVEIDEVIVDQFAQNHEKVYEVLLDNDFMTFIATIKEIIEVKNYEVYYTLLRKYSLLRDYSKSGFDISPIYDENKSESNQKEELNKISIAEILQYFENIQNKICRKFNINDTRVESWAGENFEQTLENFEKSPMIGASLCSQYKNTIYRGWIRGHLLLYSAPSGGGKTTYTIGELCNVCVTKYWDEEKQCFVKNKNRQGNGFFIHSEMKQEEEITPKFISWIANISYKKILDGRYTPEEKERLKEAGHILRESKIRLIDMPDFTLSTLEKKIKECVLDYNCVYGIHDYIWDNGVAGKEYKEEQSGTPLRQDMLLLAIAAKLKALAEDYNVGIISMTQTNGNEKLNDIVDESCLFGSKNMKSKIDGGEVILRLRKKESIEIEPLIDKKGLHLNRPNIISHVYKGRFNGVEKDNISVDKIKVWQHFDYSTGRIKDCFCTTVDNEPLKVEKLVIENE